MTKHLGIQTEHLYTCKNCWTNAVVKIHIEPCTHLKKQFSYKSSYKSHTIGSCIDYIFLSEYTINNLNSVNMKNVPKIPDHKAVTAIIKTNEVYGKG